MKQFGIALLSACLLLTASCASREPVRGMTMRIQQNLILDDQSSASDYRAWFAPPDKFRVEGTTRLKTMASDVQITIVGNGPTVKQINVLQEGTPAGGPQPAPVTRAMTVDLDRIHKELPWAEDYSPSKTYDPSLYRDMMTKSAGKRALPPEELDGAPAEGCELPLPEGRLSLPFNVSMVLPDPVKVRIWINPKDGLARKVELEDAKGRTFLKTLYTDVKTGELIPQEKFELAFPKDTEPVDITKVVLRGLEITRHPATAPGEPKPGDK